MVTLHALEFQLVVDSYAFWTVRDTHLLLMRFRHFTLGLFELILLDLRKLTLKTSDCLRRLLMLDKAAAQLLVSVLVLGILVQELYLFSLLGAAVPLLLLHCHAVNDLREVPTRVLKLWSVSPSSWHLLTIWLLLVLRVSIGHRLAVVCHELDVFLHGCGWVH